MKYSEGKIGRVFVLRLEDGDRIPDVIEAFAKKEKVARASVHFVGGVGSGKIVTGPNFREDGSIVPTVTPIEAIHEASAWGTIFPDEKGSPVLHMHSSFGRDGKAMCGCVRTGIDVWVIGEAVVFELLGVGGERKKDPETGFELLHIG